MQRARPGEQGARFLACCGTPVTWQDGASRGSCALGAQECAACGQGYSELMTFEEVERARGEQGAPWGVPGAAALEIRRALGWLGQSGWGPLGLRLGALVPTA